MSTAAQTRPTPAAAAELYRVDPVHSEVSFQVRHLVSKVRGRFTEFDGEIRMDREQPERSNVRFTVRAASIDTGVADRDTHLRSADFFDVEQFPEIVFESIDGKVTRKGEDRYTVDGTLTLRGVARELPLDVEFLGFAKDPWGNEKAGFETTLTLNRKDFGMVWNAALDNGGLLLSDEVKIAINLQFLKTQQS
jgi:polyisoprenoid-binding protein YceI